MLNACATKVPESIRQATTNKLSINEVRNNPSKFNNDRIRWGGVIIKTENRAEQTQLMILAYPLVSLGRPNTDAVNQGRFIAIIKGFIEPTLYAPDREITINGLIQDNITEKIDDYDYEYPVIKMDVHYLWPLRRSYNEDDYPFYWDTLWYPHHHPHWRHH